jgi:RimJ/RimL family protein N-acetyltransferase
MVAPEWQGAGLGTALQSRLQDYAVSRGVRGFIAEILPSNTPMLRLAGRLSGKVTTLRDEGEVRVSILFADRVDAGQKSSEGAE